MRHFTRLLLLGSVTLAAQAAWSGTPPGYNPPAAGPVGGAVVPGPDTAYLNQLDLSSDIQIYFRSGLIHLSKAIGFERKRDAETNAQARERLAQKAKDDFVRARRSFQYAIATGSNNLGYVPGAWSNVAYIDDRLGEHASALEAAERALALSPQLPVALENRGEALIGLNRVTDAKQQYLALYPAKPQMAQMLLATMKHWSQDQRASGTADRATVDELDQWIRDREQIAQGRAAR